MRVMRTRAFILIAVIMAGVIVLWHSQDASPSPRGLTVQFLGFTNEPSLGESALLLVTNGASHTFSFYIPLQETKPFAGASKFAQWKMVGLPGTNWASISVSPGKSLVAVIARPLPAAVWRVRLICEEARPRLVTALNWITHGWTDSYFPHRSSAVLSPEIHE